MSFAQSGRSSSAAPRSFGGSRFGGNRNGGRPSFGSRPGSRFGGGQRFQQRGPKPSYINPAKYVKAAVEPEPEEVYQSTHLFTDFGLDEKIVANVTRHGYTIPTPIQDQAIPALMEGKDVVGIANTGTGKTAAFLLPLIHKVLNDSEQGVLILAPTRELAHQIAEEFRIFAAGLPMSMCLCIGGANMDRQIQTLRKNPHFVIGTPGRIKDLMQRHIFNTSLFTNIVLDEVDRMLDIGFIQDIRFLITQLPPKRHAAFFSATMTHEVAGIMNTLLTDPVMVTIAQAKKTENINQDVMRITRGQNKIDVLHDLLIQEEYSRVIVFGRTKHGINRLEEELSARGLRVSAIHGNKSQNARQKALDFFKQGRVQALLATDVAARGIDIDDVSHVINYDEPQTYEDYIHRIGRTGRAGKAGKAITFING